MYRNRRKRQIKMESRSWQTKFFKLYGHRLLLQPNEYLQLTKIEAAKIIQIIKHCEDINYSCFEKLTELHLACWCGCIETVKMLISAGAYVNIKDKNGWTPLHAAAKHGSIAVSKHLLQHGADANIPNDNGILPLHFAAEQSCRLYDLLRSHTDYYTLSKYCAIKGPLEITIINKSILCRALGSNLKNMNPALIENILKSGLPYDVIHCPVIIDNADYSEDDEDDSDEDDSDEDDSGEEDSDEENSYEDDSNKDDTNKDDSNKDDFNKDDSNKDDPNNDDSEKDDSEKDDSNNDDSKKDDSNNDDSKKDNSNKDNSDEEDSNKDDSNNDDSEKDDSNNDDSKKDDSNNDDSEKDNSNKDDSDEEDSDKYSSDKDEDKGNSDDDSNEEDSDENNPFKGVSMLHFESKKFYILSPLCYYLWKKDETSKINLDVLKMLIDYDVYITSKFNCSDSRLVVPGPIKVALHSLCSGTAEKAKILSALFENKCYVHEKCDYTPAKLLQMSSLTFHSIDTNLALALLKGSNVVEPEDVLSWIIENWDSEFKHYHKILDLLYMLLVLSPYVIIPSYIILFLSNHVFLYYFEVKETREKLQEICDQTVRPLASYCRSVVRRQLHDETRDNPRKFKDMLNSLPLPNIIIEYLKFNDAPD